MADWHVAGLSPGATRLDSYRSLPHRVSVVVSVSKSKLPSARTCSIQPRAWQVVDGLVLRTRSTCMPRQLGADSGDGSLRRARPVARLSLRPGPVRSSFPRHAGVGFGACLRPGVGPHLGTKPLAMLLVSVANSISRRKPSSVLHPARATPPARSAPRRHIALSVTEVESDNPRLQWRTR